MRVQAQKQRIFSYGYRLRSQNSRNDVYPREEVDNTNSKVEPRIAVCIEGYDCCEGVVVEYHQLTIAYGFLRTARLVTH